MAERCWWRDASYLSSSWGLRELCCVPQGPGGWSPIATMEICSLKPLAFVDSFPFLDSHPRNLLMFCEFTGDGGFLLLSAFTNKADPGEHIWSLGPISHHTWRRPKANSDTLLDWYPQTQGTHLPPITYLFTGLGFTGGSVGSALSLQCKRPRFDLWVRKVPWRRKRQPAPVFLPGKSHGQRGLVGCSPWGHKEQNMTEWLSHHHRFFRVELLKILVS